MSAVVTVLHRPLSRFVRRGHLELIFSCPFCGSVDGTHLPSIPIADSHSENNAAQFVGIFVSSGICLHR